MNKLLKTINRQNGNLCFVGDSDSNSIVFECDRFQKTLVRSTSTKRIYGLCHNELNSYLVAFSDKYIGKYENNILDDTFIDTGLVKIDRIVNRIDGVFYALNKSTATIYRIVIDPFSIDWSLQVINPVNDAQENGEILVRESDSSLIYYDDEKIFVIGDMLTSGVLISSKSIGDGMGIMTEFSGQYNPAYTFSRWRQASGGELENSSSSSSSDSSSSTSDSSSSSLDDYSLVFTQSSLPSSVYFDIDCNGNGQYVYAAPSADKIYYSTDYGVNFTQSSSPTANWVSISSNGSGNKVYATENSNIYYSFDYGVTWTGSATPVAAYSVDCSYGGSIVYTGKYDPVSAGYLYKSIDSGINFSQVSSPLTGVWSYIKCSNDGQYIYAIDQGLSFSGGYVYYSNDSGVTWNQCSIPFGNYAGLACSVLDPSIVYVGEENDGNLYESTDYGVSFTQLGSQTGEWTGLACGQNGQHLYAVEFGIPSVFWSQTYGTRLRSTVIGGNAVACSHNGSKIYLASNNGTYYGEIISNL